jgi:hypothetical protein
MLDSNKREVGQRWDSVDISLRELVAGPHIALRSAGQLEWAATIARIIRDEACSKTYPRHGTAADGEDSMSEWLCFLHFSTCRITLKRVSRTKNGINVNSERRPKNTLTRECDIQRQVQQRHTTALDL